MMERASSRWVVVMVSCLGGALPACGGSQDKPEAPLAASDRIQGIDETIALFKQKDATIEELFAKSAGFGAVF